MAHFWPTLHALAVRTPCYFIRRQIEISLYKQVAEVSNGACKGPVMLLMFETPLGPARSNSTKVSVDDQNNSDQTLLLDRPIPCYTA